MKTKTTIGLLASLLLLACPPAFGQSVQETNNGGVAIKAAVVIKAAAYTAREEDHTILVDATAAAVTVTLPKAEKGRVFVVKKIDSSVNAVTVDGFASETLDGATTTTLTVRYASAQIQGNVVSGVGSWHILNKVPVVNAGEVVTTTNVITEAESGTTFYLSSATDFVSTLPAPKLGLRYKFVVKTAATTTAHTIITAGASGGANIIYGMVATADGAASVLASQEDTISLTKTATGGIVGDTVEVESDGTNWYVTGQVSVAAGITFTAT